MLSVFVDISIILSYYAAEMSFTSLDSGGEAHIMLQSLNVNILHIWLSTPFIVLVDIFITNVGISIIVSYSATHVTRRLCDNECAALHASPAK